MDSWFFKKGIEVMPRPIRNRIAPQQTCNGIRIEAAGPGTHVKTPKGAQVVDTTNELFVFGWIESYFRLGEL